MKQLNIWKTSFYTMLAIAAGAFTACVDDDVDKQAPTLELSEEAVAFTGTATEDATVTVRSNRQWTVAYEDEETQKEWMYFKVSGNEVSEGIYNGDGTVKITVGESAQPHMGRLIFTLSNSYGELYRKYLTVTQGNYVPPTVGAVGKLVEYILGNSDLSGAVGPDKAMPLQYSESTIEAVILANDAAGNNNRKLYVGDNNGLERSAIVLYGADFAMANDPVTKYPAGRKVTLNLENAKYYAFNNVRQLTDVVVTVGDEEVELVVPSLSVEKFNTGDYQAQYVKLNNMTPAQSFVGKPWTATESQSVTLNDASGKTLTVYMNKAQFATGFADMYVADKTGTIYGVAETYRENAQLIPTKKADIAALSTDQGGGTDPEPADPAHIVLDFSRGKDMATPAFPYHDKDDSSSATEGTYTIDGYTYHIKASADGKFYWFYNNYNAETKPETVYEAFFIGTTGAYIELPAISGKALSKVILTGASGASGDSEAAITDTAGADIAGGLSQVVGKGEATYDLSGTVANTSYRITVTKKNCQFAKIELFYGEGGGSTPVQPTLSVNPTSLSFAAKDQAKTIACTVANADGYTVGTSSSDAANFAASVAGTTVTVTPTENTGSARNATVTVYLTNDGGATKVAAKTVAVTQAAAGGSEPAGDTYDKITKVAELVNGMTGFIGCEPGGTYGLQLVTGFTDYGQGFTAAYTYDETKKTLSLTSGNYTAIEFTFEAVADGFNIKQGDKYLIGTGIIDNGKPKQGLVLADAPAQPWTFTEDASGVIATTNASGTVDGQAFNYPAIYMMCANSASSRFLRPYVQASYGKGFCFFKKN